MLQDYDGRMLNTPSATLGNADSASFWSCPSEQLLASLNSSAQGLGTAEAERRLREHGANALEEEPAASLWHLALRQFKSPLVLILVFGAAVSATLREWLDAGIILAIVLGSCGLGFAQELRASTAVAQLRKRLALTVKARRDGAVQTVEALQLVPGDIVQVSAGNLIPADGLVLEARDFLVTEASLTGESYPVEKQPGVLSADTPIAQRTNAVFLGTSVRSGTATVLVVHTGEHTAFGAIGARLRVAAPETEFTRGVQQFGVLLVRVMVVMVLFVLIVNQLMGRPLDRIAVVRGGAGSRPVARVAAGDHEPDAVGRGAAHGKERRHRAPPRGDREPRQHGRAVHRQDRHADRGHDVASGRHRAGRQHRCRGTAPGLPERRLRDRHRQPARRRDRGRRRACRAVHRRRTQRSTKSRTTSSASG